MRALGGAFRAYLLAYSLGAGVQDLSRLQDLKNAGCGPLVVFPAFCPLYCFTCGALCLNMALFSVLRAFLARFGVFVGVCVACVLCVACGAFVRVCS